MYTLAFFAKRNLLAATFVVGLSFQGLSIHCIMYWVILATDFSPIILLHCYSQVATVCRFISDYCVKVLLLICLPSMATKNLIVRIVVLKLQSLILLVTRKVLLLGHCFVPCVPISPQNPEQIWIIKLLRSTASQSLMLGRAFSLLLLTSTWGNQTWSSRQDNKFLSCQCRQRS